MLTAGVNTTQETTIGTTGGTNNANLNGNECDNNIAVSSGSNVTLSTNISIDLVAWALVGFELTALSVSGVSLEFIALPSNVFNSGK